MTPVNKSTPRTVLFLNFEEQSLVPIWGGFRRVFAWVPD
jgi:hypothetical protein